jgi:predicted PurR-regulated permease PerM
MRVLAGLGLATAMAVMLSPMHERVARALNERDGLPALTVTSVVAVAILIPVVTVLLMLANQAKTFYEWVLTTF